jgi:hypothetical protein
MCYCACMSLVAGLLRPRLFSSKLSKAAESARNKILCNYSTPPPPQRASIHGYLQYSGRGRSANHPHPLNTSTQETQHSCKNTYTAARRPPHPSYTQHTTTLHNNTRVHKITNVPVVFMALMFNGFEVCNIIMRGIGRGGP